VVIPTLHFRPPYRMTPDDIEHGGGDAWDKVREICEKHGVEFVENRRELAEYIAQNKIDPDDLVYGHDHQNMHGRVRIWDNIFAHLAKSSQPAYAPESRERRIEVNPEANTATEQVSLSGNWIKADGIVRTSTAGARLKVTFTGNKIALLGRKTPGGGTVNVLIDGVPGDQAPVFVTNSILRNTGRNFRSPHEVELGKNLVPQKWTITMTSNVGDYRVAGSVTGADGEGNLARPFVSNSGQISIDPKFWREGRHAKPGPDQYGNVTGEAFSFDVMRGALGGVTFNAGRQVPMAESLVQNLPNSTHTVELVAKGDGEVIIEGLYVFQPPE